MAKHTTPRSKPEASARGNARGEVAVYLGLAVVAAVVRIPLLSALGLVTYDGTVYLNEAKALASFARLPGAFPIGFPAAAALVHAVVRDWVSAGQMVSFLAAIASTLLLYALARRHAGRGVAVVAALLLTLNPLFLRLSVLTMSESLYIALVLAGMLFVVRERFLPAGLVLGAAAATRPEALAVVVVVALLEVTRAARATRVRNAAMLVAGFAVVFALNSAVLSWSTGRAVVLPKSGWLGSSAQNWKANERAVDFEGPAEWKEPAGDAKPTRGLVSEYLHSMPAELATLARFSYPAVLLLAAVGIARLGLHVYLAPLASLLFFTLFTKRAESRYLLPYIPFLILYATVGVEWLSARASAWRGSAIAVLAVCGALLLYAERARITLPEEPGVEVMKQAGLHLKNDVEPDDAVADRKPYVAFYAGGRYLEIPVAPYEDTVAFLAENAEWLALHRGTIHTLRPALRPLMYSKAVINGELRFDQVYAAGDDEVAFRRARRDDPLRWTQLSRATKADLMPAWSPDGTRLAMWSQRADGGTDLVLVSPANRALGWNAGNVSTTVLATVGESRESLSWSADGSHIAFSAPADGGARTDMDVYSVDVYGGDVEILVGGTTSDHAPTWSTTGALAFVSNRGGGDDIWLREAGGAGSRDTRQITRDGGYAFPVFSPDGTRLACTRDGLVVIDLADGSARRAPSPRQLAYAPAWSPDGELVAVTADDWGSWDIYIMKADFTNALLLTKHATREGMPAWSPDGRRMAVMSDRSGTFSVWLLDNLEPYRERLDERVRMDTLPILQAKETRP